MADAKHDDVGGNKDVLADPQNPYGSFVVNASAGTGKTYQLAHRFLCLVSAGAEPGAILTLTFTKKAAGEMRERILQEAARLMQDKAANRAFMQKMQGFYQQSGGERRYLPRPLSAAVTADRVLGASQVLKITTIDAAFMDWYRKFPWDATRRDDGEAKPPRPGTTILEDRLDSDALNQKAWQKAYWESAQHMPPEQALADWDNGEVFRQLDPLLRNETFVWGVRRERRHEPVTAAYANAINFHPTKASATTDIWSLIQAGLAEIIASSPNKARQDQWREALQQGSLEALQKAGILTKEASFHRATFRLHPRQDLLAQVEELIRDSLNQQKLAQLNRRAALLGDYYERYDVHRQALKREQAKMEFADAAFGAFTLFHEDHAVGARYLIHQRLQHILLDEFQDTNRLQWQIFHAMASELLAGMGLHTEKGIVPTLFIVGDPKQSIYGFREADASIMTEAAGQLVSFGVQQVYLTDSYRTAPLVLELVNAACQGIPGFRRHRTALGTDGLSPLIPDLSDVLVMMGDDDDDKEERGKGELLGKKPAGGEKDDEDKEITPVLREAKQVATFLARCLVKAEDYPVYNKKTARCRPLLASDVAILYREATHAQVFEDALRAQGIASRREEGKGFFARAEIEDLMALLRWASYPGDMVALLQVLKSPLFHVPDQSLMALLETLPEEEDAMRRSLALETALAVQWPAVAQELQDLRRLRLRADPQHFLAHVYRHFRLPARFREAAASEDGELVYENCQAFFRLVQQIGDTGQDDLLSVLAHLDKMALADTMGNAAASSDAVTLMTIHKAKGLEFPCVVLVGTGRDWEKRDHYWAKGEDLNCGPGMYYMGTAPMQPKDHAHFAAIYADADAKARAESERLLYVALTRAQQYLVIGSGGAAARGKAKNPVFHARLREALLAMGATLQRQPDGLSCLALTRRACTVLWEEPATKITAAVVDLKTIATKSPSPLLLPPMQVLAPHRHLSLDDVPTEPRQLSAIVLAPGEAELLQAAGNYIHAALEAHVLGKDWDGPSLWRHFVPEVGVWDSRLHEAADKEWQAVVVHPCFQALWHQATAWQTEKAIAHFDGRNLVRGYMDLFIERADGSCLVLDYKSTPLASDEQADLTFLATERGYFRQLRYYAEALQAMGRWQQVEAAVYFTKVNQMVYVPMKTAALLRDEDSLVDD